MITYLYSVPGGSDSKASACNAGDPGLIPGSGRSPGEGNGNPLQHSCLENPMDGGAWSGKGKMRSFMLGLDQIWLVSWWEEGIKTHREKPMWTWGQGLSYKSTTKESPRWPVNYQKLGGGCGTEIPSQFSEEINSASTLISPVYYPELRQCIFVV